jgi:hypothetical protein
MQTSKTRTYQEALESVGVDTKLARQAAVVLANETVDSPRTERGQRIVMKAYQQMRSEE